MKHPIGLAVTATAAAALATLAATAPAVAESGPGADVTSAAGALVVFPDPYGDGRANPAAGGHAAVHATSTPSGRTMVTLHVSAMVPNRPFGGHVHAGSCAQRGLGHYMHDPAAAATPENEVWLDFVTSSAGQGRAQSSVHWRFRTGEAHSVVIHDTTTNASGKAGPKIACLDVAF